MTEHGGEDTPCGRMEEEREVEEREEDRPARVEEQEARSVAHGEREEVVAEVEPACEPGGDGKLREGVHRRKKEGRGVGVSCSGRVEEMGIGDVPR